MEHHVECLRCHTSSSRQESFFELDLPLKNNNTVEECLKRIQSTEILSGYNKYRCASCDSLQDAERRSFVRVLPPYLNLSLMRFTYSENGRTKSKANIRYGKSLRLGNREYKLCAVVAHVGTSVSVMKWSFRLNPGSPRTFQVRRLRRPVSDHVVAWLVQPAS